MAEEVSGVDDRTMDDLAINSTNYQKQVQEQRARKKIEIVAPVQGISRKEFQNSMLGPEEMFKNAANQQ